MNEPVAWVEIDCQALAHNAGQVLGLLGEACQLCAVVKANAYGHGAALASQVFLEAGASSLAVTTVAEAAELRDAGIAAPILLLASTLPDQAEAVCLLGLTATVSSRPAAEALAHTATRLQVELPVHLLVDVGMGRDGCQPAELPALAQAVADSPGLRLDGVWCHFPNSIGADKQPTRQQLATFLAAVDRLPGRPPVLHAANSGATVDVPEARLDLARVGTLLYGRYPSPQVSRLLDLREPFRLLARLVEVRDLPAGARVGYGSEFTLRRLGRIGTVMVGWQHGFACEPISLHRGLRGVVRAVRRRPLVVTVAGQPCPVAGRVSMSSCNIDLTAVPGAMVGDLVELPVMRMLCDRGLPRLARR